MSIERAAAMANDRLLEEMATSEYAPSEAELLACAKAHVEDGNNTSRESFRQAAEALAQAEDLHGTTQASMAKAVGMSESWVSQLLTWRREGYQGTSPFGPTTKAGRVQHAKERAASVVAKQRKVVAEPDTIDGANNKVTEAKQGNAMRNADGVQAAVSKNDKADLSIGDPISNTGSDSNKPGPLAEIDLTRSGLYPVIGSFYRSVAAAESINSASCDLRTIIKELSDCGVSQHHIEKLTTVADKFDAAAEDFLKTPL